MVITDFDPLGYSLVSVLINWFFYCGVCGRDISAMNSAEYYLHRRSGLMLVSRCWFRKEMKICFVIRNWIRRKNVFGSRLAIFVVTKANNLAGTQTLFSRNPVILSSLLNNSVIQKPFFSCYSFLLVYFYACKFSFNWSVKKLNLFAELPVIFGFPQKSLKCA